MNLNQKIRTIRERNALSQEDMATKMNMSVNGYAKIERGETKLRLDKLEQIAQIFNLDIVELLSSDQQNVFLISEHSNLSSNYYGKSSGNDFVIEKLNLIISHKDELLQKQSDEIASLKKIIALLEQK